MKKNVMIKPAGWVLIIIGALGSLVFVLSFVSAIFGYFQGMASGQGAKYMSGAVFALFTVPFPFLLWGGIRIINRGD